MGKVIVHMNHLQLVYDTFSHTEHGLGMDDINRRDRQNWRSVQKLTLLRVQNCLQRLIDGDEGRRPDLSLNGTLTYLKVIWNYVEIFLQQSKNSLSKNCFSRTRCTFLGYLEQFCSERPQTVTQEEFYKQRDIPRHNHFMPFCCYVDKLHG